MENKNKMDIEFLIKEIVKIIKKYLPKEYRIFLFGSWAKGNALETSDIDIGIFGKEKIPSDLKNKILDDVEEIPTLRSIDIVDLMLADDDYKNKILGYAKHLA